MKHTLCLLTLAAAAMLVSPAFTQTSTSCTELTRLDLTLCDHSDGAGTAIFYGDSSYVVTDFDMKSWATNKSLYLQKEADSEAEAVKAGERMDAAFAQEEKANRIQTLKECVAAGFAWDGHYCSSPEYRASGTPNPVPIPAPKIGLPPADYLNSKAASIHTKKECVAAGFDWNKKACRFQ